jgi:probable rRNA maturation factor
MVQADLSAVTPAIDVVVDSPLWEREPKAVQTVEQAIATAAAEITAPPGEVAVMLTDDATIRTLNRDWRKIDKPTNVLSFPATQVPGAAAALHGDIVIAYETLAREASDEGKVFTQHLAHLAVHGFLHLMGYDHQNDSDADAMERLERAILARLDLPDPYLARDLGA